MNTHRSIRFLLYALFIAMSLESVALAQWTTSGNDIYNSNSGKVGIGTTTPQTKLDVRGGQIFNLNDGASSAYYTQTSGDTTSNYYRAFRARGSAASPASVQSGDVIASFDGFGHNGTTFPGLAAGMKVLATSTWSSSVNGALTFSTNSNGSFAERLRIDSIGNVGIGTTGPASYAALDVNTTGNKSIHTMDSTYGGLLIGYQGSTIQARTTAEGNSQSLILQNWDGNVGIGTSSPSSKLEVNGDVTVTGNISAKYQDIAEWVPSLEVIPPGFVVVLDSSQINTVTPSLKPYDTHVADVISATPGLVLGEASKDKVKVATTGRVKVRVDATKGAVHIGDLLVTSDKAGLAMRSVPVNVGGVEFHRPGTLIGKALEPLEEGEDEILVLLSLQ